MQPREVGADADAELRVEVRERLVHEEDGRAPDDRATHGDALALAAGKRERPSVHEFLEPEQTGRLRDARGDLLARRSPHLQAEGEVPADVHVWVERIVLEDHRDVALLRSDVRHVAFADEDGSVADILEPRNATQERRLPAAGWADEHDELAVFDRQVDAVDGAHAVRERLGNRL